MVGQKREEPEDEELCKIQQGEPGAAAACHGAVGAQLREKWANRRNTPKIPAWTMSSQEKVTERRRRVVVPEFMMNWVMGCGS